MAAMADYCTNIVSRQLLLCTSWPKRSERSRHLYYTQDPIVSITGRQWSAAIAAFEDLRASNLHNLFTIKSASSHITGRAATAYILLLAIETRATYVTPTGTSPAQLRFWSIPIAPVRLLSPAIGLAYALDSKSSPARVMEMLALNMAVAD